MLPQVEFVPPLANMYFYCRNLIIIIVQFFNFHLKIMLAKNHWNNNCLVIQMYQVNRWFIISMFLHTYTINLFDMYKWLNDIWIFLGLNWTICGVCFGHPTPDAFARLVHLYMDDSTCILMSVATFVNGNRSNVLPKEHTVGRQGFYASQSLWS